MPSNAGLRRAALAGAASLEVGTPAAVGPKSTERVYSAQYDQGVSVAVDQGPKQYVVSPGPGVGDCGCWEGIASPDLHGVGLHRRRPAQPCGAQPPVPDRPHEPRSRFR